MTSFLPVCADSKFPRSGEERLWSRSQNQQSQWGTQSVIDRYLCSVSPTRFSRGLSTPALNHYSFYCSLKAGWVPTREVNRRSCCSANPEHRGFFETKTKAGAVFVNLTAAYHTVWHRGLTCKLLRLLPDKHIVRMIMELV